MSRPRPTVAPANLDFLPREFTDIPPKIRQRDKYDELYGRAIRSGQIESEAHYWKRKHRRLPNE